MGVHDRSEERLMVERDQLRAENKRLREELNEIRNSTLRIVIAEANPRTDPTGFCDGGIL